MAGFHARSDTHGGCLTGNSLLYQAWLFLANIVDIIKKGLSKESPFCFVIRIRG